MTDSDRAAAEAIARKLRERGDPDVTAVEVVALIRGLGWRPTAAKPPPAWHRPSGTGIPPTDGYRTARLKLEEHLAERDRKEAS